MNGSPKDPNPYRQGTPEWLLFTNAESKEAAARAFATDAERYSAKADEARREAAEFRAALGKLTSKAA